VYRLTRDDKEQDLVEYYKQMVGPNRITWYEVWRVVRLEGTIQGQRYRSFFVDFFGALAKKTFPLTTFFNGGFLEFSVLAKNNFPLAIFFQR
jgi:hypothetical protein